jgi:hypothetical protein
MSRKNQKSKTHSQPKIVEGETIVETPAVETTETVTETAPVETQPETAPTETKAAKVKKTRYASVDVIPDAAVITWFKPLAKGPTEKSKSAKRYNRYYQTGITVEQFCQAYKENNEPRMLARNDLRWDFQHGFIQLEVPASQEKDETQAAE